MIFLNDYKNTKRVFFALIVLCSTSFAFAKGEDVRITNSTALNVRDANGTTVTPLDQLQGSEKDVETTRRIRQALMDDQTLSTNARNVKIITLKNKVTIRGVVNNRTELDKVMLIAKKASTNDAQFLNELNIVKN